MFDFCPDKFLYLNQTNKQRKRRDSRARFNVPCDEYENQTSIYIRNHNGDVSLCHHIPGLLAGSGVSCRDSPINQAAESEIAPEGSSTGCQVIRSSGRINHQGNWKPVIDWIVI